MNRLYLLQRFALSALLVVSFAQPSDAIENNAFTQALNTIVAPQLQRHAEVLADDTFEGREAGSRGGRAAAGYIVEQLEKHGVAGAGTDGGYYQTFGNGYRNILAQIPGSDPTLRGEVVLIGAHYDHVGYGTASNSYGPTGFIHNGADDNASGTAGLLEVIEACANLPEAPSRTILFAFWDGEEKGLLGSKQFASRPTVDLKSIKFMINMDMIGRLRNDTVKVFGARTGYSLRRFVSQQNTDGLLVDFDWDIKENSDHYPFYSRGIPYLMLHTDLHDDYHRPRDDAHKLNAPGMQRVSRLAFAIAVAAASRETSPTFRAASKNEPRSTKRALTAPGTNPPPRLGVTWDNELERGGGLRLTSIVAGTPAAKAALAVGDRLMTFNGQPITNDDTFRRNVLAASGSFELGVERGGQNDLLAVTIEPAGNPIRLGITWREDSAEPGTLIVVLSVPGSPASQAGVQVGDRIYSINGQSFANGDDFRRRAVTLPSPLELQLERNGQLRSVSLELAEVFGE